MTSAQPNNTISNEMRWDRVYGDPENTGKKLISTHGSSHNFQGTCGLVACANVIRLAGTTNVTEDMVRFSAQNSSLCRAYEINPLATDVQRRNIRLANGETNALQREKLLGKFYVESFQEPQQAIGDPDYGIKLIADYIIRGHVIIASVFAGKLWEDPNYYQECHAVTVIGVKTDASRENLLGFYICDSGRREHNADPSIYDMDHARYYDKAAFRDALTDRPMNVTKYPIRLKGGNP